VRRPRSETRRSAPNLGSSDRRDHPRYKDGIESADLGSDARRATQKSLEVLEALDKILASHVATSGSWISRENEFDQ
jgi:hypothetical protein